MTDKRRAKKGAQTENAQRQCEKIKGEQTGHSRSAPYLAEGANELVAHLCHLLLEVLWYVFVLEYFAAPRKEREKGQQGKY